MVLLLLSELELSIYASILTSLSFLELFSRTSWHDDPWHAFVLNGLLKLLHLKLLYILEFLHLLLL